MLLSKMLERIVRHGSLTLIDAKGKRYLFGDGGEPAVTIRVHDPALHWRIPMNPTLHAGEAYMDGTLTIEDGTLQDFLDLTTREIESLQGSDLIHRVIRVFGKMIRLVQQYNYVARARRNVAHHYDLSDKLYDLFLDSDRQYSCAYFTRPDESLAEAQHHKKVHIAAKLLLDRPGLRVLDIGSGWGGLALFLAKIAGADVTGLTLSREQAARSEERANAAGLSNRVRFLLQDYRQEKGEYDRIVSVGMFEHVGAPQYPTFFRKMCDMLKPDGVALLHFICRMDGPGMTDPWIRKYIFPGGYAPALSEVLPIIERMGLWVTDIEVLRLHYAETLKNWQTNFQAHRDEIAKLYDERFCRMWEFYLAGCEMAFRNMKQMVCQIQLAKQPAAVPLTRDYIVDWERTQLAKAATEAA
jgi:cyclopropane-fatty-acyl-phospholipid synthase